MLTKTAFIWSKQSKTVITVSNNFFLFLYILKYNSYLKGTPLIVKLNFQKSF